MKQTKQLTLFPPNTDKDLVVHKYMESGGDTDCRVVKAPDSFTVEYFTTFYFLYWIDGQVEYRDTFAVNRTKAVVCYLCVSHKRYSDSKHWIESR